MKKTKIFRIIASISLCVVMAVACSVNTLALSTGPSGSNIYNNTTTYFTIEGTLFESTQSKYSYDSGYDKINSTYYTIDACGITSKSSGGNARRFYVRATTTKRSTLASIYNGNPYASASPSILYDGYGDLTCSVTGHTGLFPLGSEEVTVHDTESYCEAIVACRYSDTAKLTGTVTSRKSYGAGTVHVNVEAF